MSIELKKEFLSLNFLLLFISSISRNTSNLYYIDQYKYIGLGIVKNDELLSFTFSFGAFFNFLGRVVCGMLWNHINIKVFYIIALVLNIFNCIVFIFIGF